MDNDHGITGELREWAEDALMRLSAHEEVAAIADRIDAEHERAVMGAMNDALYQANEERMAELGWVRLPVDADGKVIYIGDEMDTEHFGTVEVEGFIHRSIAFYNYAGQPAYICTSPTALCRHHHAPTVEDVLHELVDEWVMASSTEDEEAAIAEYAAKLRLAGDAE